jgi:hypothetical protein
LCWVGEYWVIGVVTLFVIVTLLAVTVGEINVLIVAAVLERFVFITTLFDVIVGEINVLIVAAVLTRFVFITTLFDVIVGEIKVLIVADGVINVLLKAILANDTSADGLTS